MKNAGAGTTAAIKDAQFDTLRWAWRLLDAGHEAEEVQGRIEDKIKELEAGK